MSVIFFHEELCCPYFQWKVKSQGLSRKRKKVKEFVWGVKLLKTENSFNMSVHSSNLTQLSINVSKLIAPLTFFTVVKIGCCCSAVSSSLRSHELQHARLSVLQYLPEFAQTHVHWVDDTIQTAHPLLPCSPPALNLFQHQGLLQVGFLHQMAKVLELQFQYQSFQWVFRIDFP